MSVAVVLLSAANTVAELVVRVADQTPKDEDVSATNRRDVWSIRP